MVTRKAVFVQHDTAAHSDNNCLGIAISITYSDCASAALVI